MNSVGPKDFVSRINSVGLKDFVSRFRVSEAENQFDWKKKEQWTELKGLGEFCEIEEFFLRKELQ